MIPKHALDWLKLTLVPGLGPASIHKLTAALGQPGAIFQAPESQLTAAGVKAEVYRALKAVDDNRLQQACAWLEASPSHHLLCIDDPQYPALLKAIHDAPPILFIAPCNVS